MFAAQLHGILAERMGVRTNADLGEAMFKRLEHQQRLLNANKSIGKDSL